METVRLTTAEAIVRHLAAQRSEQGDGSVAPLFPGVYGIVGHGNVTSLGLALEAHRDVLPTWRAELEWVHMGSYYLEPDNQHEYEGHSLLNLRLRAPFAERWEAALRVTNLLDEDYAERADFGFGSYRYFVGQPLGAYVELSYQVGG